MSDDLNPYAAPTTEDVPQASGVGSGVTLFTPKQVGVTSFLASAAAGAALIAVNEWKLGRQSRAIWSLVGGAAFLALVVASTFVAPDIPGFPLGAASAVAMYYAAKSMSGAEVEEQALRGFPPASNGVAVGWAVMGLLGGLAVIVVTAFVFEAVGG